MRQIRQPEARLSASPKLYRFGNRSIDNRLPRPMPSNVW